MPAVQAPVWPASGGTNGATSSTTITKPSGVQPGDLLVAMCVSSGTANLPTAPAGWKTEASRQDGASVNEISAILCTKVAGFGEPATYSFTAGSGSAFNGWAILRIPNADTQIRALDASVGAGATTTSIVATGQTASAPGDLAILIFNSIADALVSTWPGGFSTYAPTSDTANSGFITGIRTFVPKANTGNLTTTLASAPTTASGFLLLVKALPQPYASVTPPGHMFPLLAVVPPAPRFSFPLVASAASGANQTQSAGASIALLQAGLTKAASATLALKAADLTKSAGASLALQAAGLTRAAAATLALQQLGATKSAGASLALLAAGLTKSGAATIALKAANLTKSASATIALAGGGTSVAAGASIALKAAGLTQAAGASLALLSAGNTKAAGASLALLSAGLTQAAAARIALSATLTRAASATLALKAAGLSRSAAATIALAAPVGQTLIGFATLAASAPGAAALGARYATASESAKASGGASEGAKASGAASEGAKSGNTTLGGA